MPVVLMNTPSPFAPVHHFRVSGDDADPGLLRCALHRLHHPPQVVHRQALFQDQAGGEAERSSAAHGQIIDRAVHGQRADVAAGEEQRADHEGIGGKGEFTPLAPARRGG